MKRVYVYWNLHKNCWSYLVNGKSPVKHAKNLLLANVELRVRQGGYEKVQKTGVKNVHAFAVGQLVEIDGGQPEGLNRTITYHPKEPGKNYFYDVSTGERVTQAETVYCDYKNLKIS